MNISVVSSEMTLAELLPGERARITKLLPCHQVYRQKFLVMGLLPGVEVLLQRFAPLGDPLQILLRGFSLSLRKSEARLLVVERIGNG